MDIRIGLTQVARELSFETDESRKDIEKRLTEALKNETGVVSFESTKGNAYLIPVRNIGYIEYGEEEERRIGFVS